MARRSMGLAVAGLLTAGSLVSMAAPAQAAGTVVTVNGSTITVAGTPGPDDIVVGVERLSTGAYVTKVIEDPGVTGTAGACTTESFWVECTTSTVPAIVVDLGAGNDTFRADWQESSREVTLRVNAGPGDDKLKGADFIETWDMGEGNDYLEPDDGSRAPGPDDISGGPGTDEVYYLHTPATQVSGLTISFDDVANDGSQAPGDVDNVRTDIEKLTTTNENDTIVGNDLPQHISGASGDDIISGLGGDDVIDGRGGRDTIDGGTGNDTLYGGWDNDTIVGGPGLDTINGDTTDLLDTGNDTIDAVDGEKDYVACGPGSDSVRADDIDDIAAQAQDTCEQVVRVNAPVPPGGTGEVSLASKKLKVDKKRRTAALRLTCKGTATCAGKVIVKAAKGKKKATLAKGTYSFEPGGAKIKLKLTKAGKKALKRSKKVKVVLTLGSAKVKAVLVR